MNFSVEHPVRIVFGPAKSADLAEVCAQYGEKAFIVTMSELANLGLLKSALAGFDQQGREYTLYTDVKPEPQKEDFDAAISAIREGNYDVVVGVGGGSCVDFAKALAICATHPHDVWSYVNLSNKPPKPVDADKVLPVIAVPTTSGTGSEVTPFSVVINRDTMQEGTIKEPSIFPKVAIVDPELMVGLPANWTAITGVDAFSHALESYFNKQNRTPYSDMICLEAIRWIVEHLPTAYRDGSDMVARSGMAYGATLAGLAISMAGTTVGHALVHPTDARVGTPHGVSVSIYLLAVLKHTLPTEGDRFVNIAKIFAPDFQGSQNEVIQHGVESIETFLAQFDFPKKLSDYGVTMDQVEEIVDDTVGYMFRPLNQHVKSFNRDDLHAIVMDSY
ncbi:MAG: iron-containing alcohol dehydrogenase [Magnetovibrio sp.]|nr:iron-containing alcohol dehydrogenase [Magnetovibrio sp.]